MHVSSIPYISFVDIFITILFTKEQLKPYTRNLLKSKLRFLLIQNNWEKQGKNVYLYYGKVKLQINCDLPPASLNAKWLYLVIICNQFIAFLFLILKWHVLEVVQAILWVNSLKNPISSTYYIHLRPLLL